MVTIWFINVQLLYRTIWHFSHLCTFLWAKFNCKQFKVVLVDSRIENSTKFVIRFRFNLNAVVFVYITDVTKWKRKSYEKFFKLHKKTCFFLFLQINYDLQWIRIICKERTHICTMYMTSFSSVETNLKFLR